VSFSDTPDCVARELARELADLPSVLAVDRIAADLTPSGHVELEVIAEATDRGTVPNAVTHLVVQSSLGIADCDPHNVPGYKRVIVR
jgi:ABC-type phosphate transport system ATPase subunit